jgi:hypothetical protein
MNVPPLMLVVLAVVMLKRLSGMYVGGHYVCPSCGARSQDRHSSDCPWGTDDSE